MFSAVFPVWLVVWRRDLFLCYSPCFLNGEWGLVPTMSHGGPDGSAKVGNDDGGSNAKGNDGGKDEGDHE